MEAKLLRSMTLLRTLSACLEVTAAILFWRLSRLDQAMRLNALLGAVGPIIFSLVSMLGIWGLSDRMPVSKLLLVGLGVLLVIWGTRS